MALYLEKNPVPVKAVAFKDGMEDGIAELCGREQRDCVHRDDGYCMRDADDCEYRIYKKFIVRKPEFEAYVKEGDYIVTYPDGRTRVLPQDEFLNTFQVADDGENFAVPALYSLNRRDIELLLHMAFDAFWVDGICCEGQQLTEEFSKQLSAGGKLKFHVMGEDGWHILDHAGFLNGVRLYLQNDGGSFIREGKLHTYDMDSDDAQKILQYAVLGKEIYS